MNTSGKYLMTTVFVGTLAAAVNAQAQTPPPTYTPPPNYSSPPPTPPPPAPAYENDSIVYPYHSQEFSADFFAAGITGENHHYDHYNYHLRDAHAGGGVGLNYFFCKYVGVGADTVMEGLNPFVYSASGNVIGRFPIGTTGLAPYVFAGGGYQFHDDRTGFGQAGAGLEYRFMQHVGVFVDGRGVLPGEHRDYGLFRGGLRVNF